MKNFMHNYNYSISNNYSNFLINLIPLKCEIITWKNTLKHNNLKHIFSIPYYYIKRIICVNFSQQNKLIYQKLLENSNYDSK